MIEQLFNLIQQESHQEIIDNPLIPNDQNNHAVGLATDSIFNGLQGAVSNGGVKDILAMFTQGGNTGTGNPIVGNIIQNLIGSLSQKFGLNPETAGNIASSLIPGILGKLVSRTQDPNDNNFQINDIMGSLLGGHSAEGGPVQLPGDDQPSGGIDFGDILKKMGGGGLDSNGDGSLGIDDLSGILGKVTQGNTGSGGVMDILKGFMK